MGAFDYMMLFSDDQDVASGTLSSGSSVVSTNTCYNSAAPTDAFAVSIDHQFGGGLEWTVAVSDEATAGGTIQCKLTTKDADASISSSGTTVAQLDVAASTAVKTPFSLMLPAETKLKKYVGVVYTASGGNVTAGHITSYLGPKATNTANG